MSMFSDYESRAVRGMKLAVTMMAGLILVVSVLCPVALKAQNLVLNPAMNAPAGQSPESLVHGDFNGDGWLDVITANSGSDDITVLSGNGNGTFQAGISFGVAKSPMALATGDFNNDGTLDLAVAANGADGVMVLAGKGNGFFQRPVAYPTGKGPTFVTVSDLDKDGLADMVVVNSGRFGYYPPFHVSVLRNHGGGQFEAAVAYEESGRDGMFPTGVHASDFTGDGFPDLAVTWSQPSWRSPNGLVSILRNRGDATFEISEEVKAGMTLSAVNGADLDGDGDTDLVVTSLFTDEAIVLSREAGGRFKVVRHLPVGFSPIALEIKDLNGDQIPDLVITNRASNSVSFWLGQGRHEFRKAGHFGVGLIPTSQVVEDFDNDGRHDVVVSNSGSNDISVLLSSRDGVPSIALSTEVLDFGESDSANTHAPKTLTLSNVGIGPLMISKVDVSGGSPQSFSVNEQLCVGQFLTTGKSCQITVAFTPLVPGLHRAEVTIWDNAPGGPRVVTLSGQVKS